MTTGRFLFFYVIYYVKKGFVGFSFCVCFFLVVRGLFFLILSMGEKRWFYMINWQMRTSTDIDMMYRLTDSEVCSDFISKYVCSSIFSTNFCRKNPFFLNPPNRVRKTLRINARKM